MSTPAWAKPRIFVSHAHADNSFCRKLVGDLRVAGADVWYDEHNLGWGELRVDIDREMPTRPYFIAILSPDAIKSRWVNREIDGAVGLMDTGEVRVFLPIVARTCKVPPTLSGFRRIDATSDYSGAFEVILRALGLPLHPPASVAPQPPAAPFAPISSSSVVQPEQQPIVPSTPRFPQIATQTTPDAMPPPPARQSNPRSPRAAPIAVFLGLAILIGIPGLLILTRFIALGPASTGSDALFPTSTTSSSAPPTSGYSVRAPGPCDTGHPNYWSASDGPGSSAQAYECTAQGLVLPDGSDVVNWIGPANSILPSSYSISITISGLSGATTPLTSDCGGVKAVASAQPVSNNSVIGGDFQVCSDGTWYVSSANAQSGKQGMVPVQSQYVLTVAFQNRQFTYSIDGKVVAASDKSISGVFQLGPLSLQGWPATFTNFTLTALN